MARSGEILLGTEARFQDPQAGQSAGFSGFMQPLWEPCGQFGFKLVNRLRHAGCDVLEGPVNKRLRQTGPVRRLEKVPRRDLVDAIVPVSTDERTAAEASWRGTARPRRKLGRRTEPLSSRP